MLNPSHLANHVIKPTLEYLGNEYSSPSAVCLLIGTALVESRLKHLVQLGGGPAKGIYQIEDATESDVWRYVSSRDSLDLRTGLLALLGPTSPLYPNPLVYNLAYQTAIARLKYYMIPEPLPSKHDSEGLGAYWKRYYNTSKGRGMVEDFISLYRKYEVDEL